MTCEWRTLWKCQLYIYSDGSSNIITANKNLPNTKFRSICFVFEKNLFLFYIFFNLTFICYWTPNLFTEDMTSSNMPKLAPSRLHRKVVASQKESCKNLISSEKNHFESKYSSVILILISYQVLESRVPKRNHIVASLLISKQ